MNQLLTVLVFLILGVSIPELYAQNEQPNILLIIADDMGIDVTNGYQQNDKMPVTPSLDMLRANGITYKNVWSAPTCTPTRASIMSGKYGVKTGVMKAPGNLDFSHTSLFNKLTETTNDAYAKAVIGKWHISNPVDYNHPEQHGVDHYEGLFTAQVADYYDWEKINDGVVSQESEYVTTNLTNAAINWINEQDKSWHLWMSHVAPHRPFHTPPDGLYSITNITSDWDRYIAAIEAMDHEIGRLIDSMDEATKKNTIIIFLGDNGTPGLVGQFFDQSHAKASIYEGGVRVPMVVSGKGVDRINAEEDGLVHVADMYATILELAGHQLDGGINNSLSIKPSFSCSDAIKRNFVYTDFEESSIQNWAIRNDQYKLIEDQNGNQEFYDIIDDILEENDLLGSLTAEQEVIVTELSNEAEIIRTGWSCADGIKNGDEVTIDSCNVVCSDDTALSKENIGCCASPEEPSVFYEYVEGDRRYVYTNDFPNHNYCFNPNLVPEQKHYNFGIDLNPQISGTITSMIRPNGRPERYFGVAKNGVVMAPAPAAPFIFENPNTGEFNWDWVFEPINNQGDGNGLVMLDCSSAHTGPQGYHYHGDMYEYMETIIPGITTLQQTPVEPIHIGWAADGFPILYRFGPDTDGNIKELAPSFQLKSGARPGDGIEAPCGAYNGRYTNDYEYICGKGELDTCNGINAAITLVTSAGPQTFEYFYVISSSFPQIPRCLVGNVSADFNNTATALTGVDNDNDGFLVQFDCDDNDPTLNPLTADEDCNVLSVIDFDDDKNLYVGPNPSEGTLTIAYIEDLMQIHVFDLAGRLITNQNGQGTFEVTNLPSGVCFVKIVFSNRKKTVKKILVR